MPHPSTDSAYGIWTLNEVRDAVRGDNWPSIPVFATLDPLNTHSTISLSNGNLGYTHNDANGGITVGTIGVASGKYYWEVYVTTSYSLLGMYQSGAIDPPFLSSGSGNVALGFTSGGFVNAVGGPTYVNSVSFSINDIVGFALDSDANTLTIYINGSATNLVFSNLTGTWFPAEGANSTSTGVFNFGQDSSFAGAKTAQNNTDANGIGDFYYAPPSGYLALASTNV